MRDDSARTMRLDIHPDLSVGKRAGKKGPVDSAGPTQETLQVVAASEQHAGSSYKKLLESIYDAVLITDYQGRVLDFNRRSVDFFLCDEADLGGKSILERISGSDRSVLDVILNNLRNHRYTLIEAHCVRSDQSTFPAEVAVNKIDLDAGGQLCFFVRDTTVRKRAQDALEDAVRRLEEHDRSRSQFVSNVSHELRTPLTSMIYAVNNLLRGVAGPISAGVEKYLNLLQGDCKRLLDTVNDILDLRKIENKTLVLAKTRIPLSRLVRRTAESLLVQAERKQQRLEIDAPPGRWFVECDVQKIERVLLNLIGNAIKFTEDGGMVRVRICDEEGRPGHVLVAVEDDGIGIPAEAVSRVTERYFTVGEQACGTGLGLAISKEIVELHGGTLVVESPPRGAPKGTGAYVSLSVVEPPKVLVVDDERLVLDVLVGQISGQGYQVLTARNGADALAMLEREKPDAVVLDLLIPEIDGTEVVLKMRSQREFRRTPVVVVTGGAIGWPKAQILGSFSVPLLPKPWVEEDLLDKLEGAFLGVSAMGK